MGKLQPKLRFPEFKDDWRIYRIDEIGTIITGTTPSTAVKEYYNGDNLFLSPADIDNSRFVDNTKTTLSDLGFNKTRKLKPNSIAFVCIGSTIGKIAQVKKEFSTNQQINSIEFNIEFSEDFNYYNLLNKSKEIKLLAGVQTMPQINKTDFSKIKLNIPTLQEQTKIADFLGAVDKQLDILNQKKGKLNTYKKGVMQQLFAQQLRFKDDNGNNYPDWQEKCFDEIFESVPTKKHQIKSSEYLNEGVYPIVDQGQKFIVGFSNEKEKVFKTKGSIIFGDHTTILKYIDFNFIIGADGVKVLQSKTLNDIKFLYYNLSFNNVKSEGYKRHYSILKELKLHIPSIEEQTKIAEFLSAIDKQIEAVENQITKTETYKKGLLQQMFV